MKKVIGLWFALVAVALIGMSAVQTEPGLAVGDTAPDFTLRNIDGKMVSLADFPDAKGFIVTFTCNTCPYAVMYEDRLIELHQKMAAKGYPVIAIQPNDPEVQPGDSFEKMQERAKEKGFPFAYLLDEGQEIYPAYGASRTPHVFLLDKSRKVRYIGAIDDNPQDETGVTRRYVEEAVAAMEAGNEPELTFTKAIGCTIKTKKKG
ncbi:MAG: thioredoxin family protein [Lewinellaceae bacterium]|nr:thioredoxin family protein [Lewinellaceae bacterium]